MNEEKLRDLFLSNEGDKYIKKMIKRSFQQKKISKEVMNELFTSLEKREDLKAAQKRAKKSKTSNKDPFEKILSITPPASKKEFKEEYISEESEDFIEAKKEYEEYFSQFSKDKTNEERLVIAQKVYNEIHNGSYSEDDKYRLYELKYQYLTNQLTKEEFDKYWEFESNQDQVIANAINGNLDLMKSFKQRYEGFLKTIPEDTTTLSVVRDFKSKLYNRILEPELPWLIGKSGSVLSDKKDFKEQWDFDWAVERVGKDLVIFKKHVKNNCHNITKRKFYNNKLIEIAKDFTKEIEKIRMERLS